MAPQAQVYEAGLDIGSTTAKIALVDKNGKLVFSDYQRHNTKVYEIINLFLDKLPHPLENCKVNLLITGSAGMGISEKTGIPFIQEVVATEEVIRHHHPEVKTLLDIGGEDSKMIFFNSNRMPDIRMNGNCAGGTGAFIDQIATLLNVTPSVLNDLAKNHKNIYPIASRCGVFAKTDVQNLVSRKIPKEDIAASVFHAVAIQCMNTLARGFEINPKVMLCGGPFTFLSELGRIFLKAVNLDPVEAVKPEHPELLPALGAALAKTDSPCTLSIKELKLRLAESQHTVKNVSNRLSPLFESSEQYQNWKDTHSYIEIPSVTLSDYQGNECFLGIDSGSTTTKITVTGTNDELLFSWYRNNHGNPVNTVIEGLQEFKTQVDHLHPDLTVSKSAVTGYGEDLIKAAFGIDNGIVETIAHYTAAKYVSPDVSFVLDIGGQDMKAIFIENGIINRIELNEACSSGCGSFIETFGNSLNYAVADFAEIACHAEAPCDLGTRCTVFMNSKVKQSLRENASVEEISAGLAYSVIKNCLFKVLKLTNMEELGEHIVLQGGTFKNPSIVRAMELLSEKDVKCSNIPELMGAYGASLVAKHTYQNLHKGSSFVGLEYLESVQEYKTRQVQCKGCENNCTVTRFTFNNKNAFFSGNKCEKFFVNKGDRLGEGANLFDYKFNTLFDQSLSELKKPRFTMGIPRVLSIYENFPFWYTLFHRCNIAVELSSSSTMKLYEKGLGSVMSDSICFPAKLTHGHITDLTQKGVDRIFYPLVFYEYKEFEDSLNSFNCPIVSSYGEVIESSMNPAKRAGIPFDKPVINFKEDHLLKKTCVKYLKQFGVSKSTIFRAVDQAIEAQNLFKENLRSKARELIEKARKTNSLLMVIAGRPYHVDPLINHKTPDILASLGVDVIPEDSMPTTGTDVFKTAQVLTQWSYPNRIYNAAEWVAKQPDNFQFVQFNSFGCGPDALVMDETRDILKTGRKNHTLIKIDEITSTGSVRLRLRSMIESLKLKRQSTATGRAPRVKVASFEEKDKHRDIIATEFSENYSPLVPALFSHTGYNIVNLPTPNRESVEYGLKYSNNDICYPATIVIGDFIKAIKEGNYNPDEVAIGITQTGGQCRASSYVSLIKRALLSAGYPNVPVVSLTLAEGLNEQPGFVVDWLKLSRILFYGMMYADCLAKMYYSTVVREKQKGAAKAVQRKYLRLADGPIRKKDYQGMLDLLVLAVEEFNAIEVNPGECPKIGVVGEIYVKYNSFGHQGIVDWLTEKGIEVVVPPLIDFFLQDFVNAPVNRKAHLRKTQTLDAFVKGFDLYLDRYKNRFIKIYRKFHRQNPFHDLKTASKKAARILDLSNQFGEGWLIAAEIATFADEGIHNIISLQPFGCIANHVISKGVETRIKELYPDMNLLFLDFEAGTSEVNILNRLFFMMKSVTENQVVA